MANTSPPRPRASRKPGRPVFSQRSDRAADAVWRKLTDGHSEEWLNDVRNMRYETDDFETSLDIWTVALTAELKKPERRELASLILRRLIEMAEGTETESASVG